jgi:hypothetical protein
MSNRLQIPDQKELLQFASEFPGAVLDVHYYNLFDSKFENLTVQQNIDFVRNNRSAELAAITNQNGRPLTFVGKQSGSDHFVSISSSLSFQQTNPTFHLKKQQLYAQLIIYLIN